MIHVIMLNYTCKIQHNPYYMVLAKTVKTMLYWRQVDTCLYFIHVGGYAYALYLLPVIRLNLLSNISPATVMERKNKKQLPSTHTLFHCQVHDLVNTEKHNQSKGTFFHPQSHFSFGWITVLAYCTRHKNIWTHLINPQSIISQTYSHSSISIDIKTIINLKKV